MMTRTDLLVLGLIFRMTSVSSTTAEVEHDNPTEKLEDEVLHLIGEADFRDVVLRWQYGDDDHKPRVLGFQVHYCELQAWGQYRCRNKVVENQGEESSPRPPQADVTTASSDATTPAARHSRAYSTRISGLRMATTYSFEVRPVRRESRDLTNTQAVGSKSVIVPTKGFSARATQCLPHASEVEVATGPHFGGRIAVEAADGGPERCSLQGNPNSAQDAYILRIHHAECGSVVNETTVATYVIVQENLPILTHSTRRFLVLCTYKPETLTVRAGINLPKPQPDEDVLYSKPSVGQVEPYDDREVDSNEILPARLEASKEDAEDNIVGEISLVMFLVVAAFGGTALLIWKAVPQTGGDDVSVATSYFSRTSMFSRRNRDRFSDQSSIYSITLSERDEDTSKMRSEGDNVSEA